MNIHDSSPDRRNLIVLSLSIIIFYLGGGQLTENADSVKLQLINVTLQNPQVLIYLVWVMLFWFVYRYWLLNKGSWLSEYKSETVFVYNRDLPSILMKMFNKNFDKKLKLEGKSTPASHVLLNSSSTPPGVGLKFKHRYKDHRGSYVDDYSSIDTVGNYLIMIICTIVTAALKPTLTTYFTPYFLFAVAVGLGLSHWIVF